MNDSYKAFIDRIKHENKSFELEAKQLFTEMIELIGKKEKEWELLYPPPHGLDGGFNPKHIIHEYYQKLDKLKITYKIEK